MKKAILLTVISLFVISSVAMGKEPVRVGLISVLSGPLAVIGKGEEYGGRMAVEDYGEVLQPRSCQ
jgi:hypothetical protein